MITIRKPHIDECSLGIGTQLVGYLSKVPNWGSRKEKVCQQFLHREAAELFLKIYPFILGEMLGTKYFWK